jgi:hypothetical protein
MLTGAAVGNDPRPMFLRDPDSSSLDASGPNGTMLQAVVASGGALFGRFAR